MDNASAGATGWTTFNSGLAFAIGFLVCIVLTLFVAKPLADRGKERYIFWVMMSSFVSVTLLSLIMLSLHSQDRAVFLSPDNRSAVK